MINMVYVCILVILRAHFDHCPRKVWEEPVRISSFVKLFRFWVPKPCHFSLDPNFSLDFCPSIENPTRILEI